MLALPDSWTYLQSSTCTSKGSDTAREMELIMESTVQTSIPLSEFLSQSKYKSKPRSAEQATAFCSPHLSKLFSLCLSHPEFFEVLGTLWKFLTGFAHSCPSVWNPLAQAPSSVNSSLRLSLATLFEHGSSSCVLMIPFFALLSPQRTCCSLTDYLLYYWSCVRYLCNSNSA